MVPIALAQERTLEAKRVLRTKIEEEPWRYDHQRNPGEQQSGLAVPQRAGRTTAKRSRRLYLHAQQGAPASSLLPRKCSAKRVAEVLSYPLEYEEMAMLSKGEHLEGSHSSMDSSSSGFAVVKKRVK